LLHFFASSILQVKILDIDNNFAQLYGSIITAHGVISCGDDCCTDGSDELIWPGS